MPLVEAVEVLDGRPYLVGRRLDLDRFHDMQCLGWSGRDGGEDQGGQQAEGDGHFFHSDIPCASKRDELNAKSWSTLRICGIQTAGERCRLSLAADRQLQAP